jgi:hypothetical protein
MDIGPYRVGEIYIGRVGVYGSPPWISTLVLYPEMQETHCFQGFLDGEPVRYRLT